jgi:hypothetical protein
MTKEEARLHAFILRLSDHLYLAADVLSHLAEKRRTPMPKPEPQTAGTIVKDQEIAALSKIGKLLADLDADQRERVLSWIGRKYAKPEAEATH